MVNEKGIKKKREPHEYGPWLRAMPYNPGKTPYVVVPGMGDGLGGVPQSVLSSNTEKSPASTAKPTRKSTERPEFDEKESASQMNMINMEIQDTGEHITLNIQNNNNPISKVFNSNPNIIAFHTEHINFEVQIQEIDEGIDKFNECGEHVDNSIVGDSHVLPISKNQATPSLPAQPLLIQEQTHHVIENSPSPNPRIRTLRTWKKLARESSMETDTPLSPTAIKRNREEELEYLLELPTKKL